MASKGAAEWISLAISFGIAFFVWLLCFILYSIFRRSAALKPVYLNVDWHENAQPASLPNVIAPYRALPTLCGHIRRAKQPPQVSPSLFGWVGAILKTDISQLTDSHGGDVVAFVRFLKAAVLLFAAYTVIGIGVILPVNVAAGTNHDLSSSDADYVDGIGVTTMANIETGSPLHWIHFCAVLGTAVLMCVVIARAYRLYAATREHLLKREDLVENFSIIVRDVPTDLLEGGATGCGTNPASAYWAKLFGEGAGVVSAVPAPPAKLLGKVREAETNRYKAFAQLEKSRWLLEHDENGERPMKRLFPKLWAKVDAIEFWEGELQTWSARVEKRRNKCKGAVAGATTSAVVTFATRRQALLAGQAQTHRAGSNTTSSPASVEPAAIDWKGMAAGAKKRYIASIVVGILLLAMVLLYIIPVTFVAGLARLEELSKLNGFGWLADFMDSLPLAAGAVLQGVVPAVVMTILMSVLPPIIITLLVRQRGHATSSEVDNGVYDGYTAFLVFHVLFVIAIAGSIFQSLSEVIDSTPTTAITLLASAFPQQSFFYLNFLIWQLPGLGLALLRPVNLILFLIFKKLGKTEREQWAVAAAASGPFAFHLGAAKVMTVFFVGQVYVVMSPLVALAALVYFALAFLVMKNNLVYVHRNPYYSHGSLMSRMLRSLMVAGIVYVVIMVVLINSREAFIPACLLIPVVFAIPIFWRAAITLRYRRSTEVLGLEHFVEEEGGQLAADIHSAYTPAEIQQGSTVEMAPIIAEHA